MTKIGKLLGLVAVAVLVGSGALLSGTGAAHAEPVSPARFVGTVTIDGEDATSGTTVEARVNGASCGVTTVFISGGEARYALDVEASQPDGDAACGTDGADVTFYIGGMMAQETGSWHNYQLNTLNLTYVTPTPTPTPTNTPVPATSTPVVVVVTATPTPLPPTPLPPDTGQGMDAESGSGALGLLVVAVALGAVAFGVGGTVAARRGR